MDGRVLQEVFRADSEPMTREVTYAEAESRTQEQRREAEDSQEVKDRLRALGYLD
jgi:hypothetical protein